VPREGGRVDEVRGHERHRGERGLGEAHEHEAEGEGALRADVLDGEAAAGRPEGGERHQRDEDRSVLRVGKPP
jgi:hypothetical protein